MGREPKPEEEDNREKKRTSGGRPCKIVNGGKRHTRRP